MAGIIHPVERGAVMVDGRDGDRCLPDSPIMKGADAQQAPLRRLHDFLDEISWADPLVEEALSKARRAARTAHPETVMARVWPFLRFEEPTYSYQFIRLLLENDTETADDGSEWREPAHRGWRTPGVPAFADLAPCLTAGVLEGLVLAWRKPVPTPLLRQDLLRDLAAQNHDDLIIEINGERGIGKSVFARALARRVIDPQAAHVVEVGLSRRLPDGRLGLPRPVQEVQREILHNLGVPPAELPDDPEDLKEEFRAVTAAAPDRVYVLDDVPEREDFLIEEVLPERAARVILVSRERLGLSEITNRRVVENRLGPLDEEQQRELLGSVCGELPLAAEPGLRHILMTCRGVARAVLLAGAAISLYGVEAVGSMAARLDRDGTSAVDTLLDLHGRLSGEPASSQARVLGVVAHFQERVIDQRAIAVASGLSTSQVEREMDRLAEAKLVERVEVGDRSLWVGDLGGRVRCPDVVAERAQALDHQRQRSLDDVIEGSRSNRFVEVRDWAKGEQAAQRVEPGRLPPEVATRALPDEIGACLPKVLTHPLKSEPRVIRTSLNLASVHEEVAQLSLEEKSAPSRQVPGEHLMFDQKFRAVLWEEAVWPLSPNEQSKSSLQMLSESSGFDENPDAGVVAAMDREVSVDPVPPLIDDWPDII
ncbi:hypothetical protein AGRA3207_001935 [Actinomadura graeca]|uniref:NB-ARC domain-containing protein n=1 Tax=Actinomadura graeca TaxID=2750812 RepID=A0ABX8QWG0_9ACTN|nr:NB-ARC domain-containing protein [Actinomadura graeca]QXJ21113.1 hypothetical protein AGRA3207_001935 [Actinomadura graeca]